MSQDWMDSIYDYDYGEYGFYGPDPCDVSSLPSFRIDVKNVAAVS